jgi:DNA-binding CsgD family transcriptional regulator
LSTLDLSQALLELGNLLLELHTAGDLLPFPDFQHEALRLVQAVLPFDSALWAVGTYQPNGIPLIFSVSLFNQPQEMLFSYERVKDRDRAFAKAMAEPGVTANIAAADIAWDAHSEPMKVHVERYGMAHTLATLTRGPITELLSSLCLYRSDPARPFSERERAMQQALVPHLVALYDRSRIQFLADQPKPGQEQKRRAAAIVDGSGMLHSARPSFIQLLLLEWPEWRGPTLPRAMLELVHTAGRTMPFTRIVGQATPVNDLFLVNLREIAPCDRLSEREWAVASAFGEGMSHKEVARRLGIAPGTVRNHLSTAYAKLGVSNKAELVRVLETALRSA